MLELLRNQTKQEGVFMFKSNSSIPKLNQKCKGDCIPNVIQINSKKTADFPPLVDNAKTVARFAPSTPEKPQFCSSEKPQICSSIFFEQSYRLKRYYAQHLSAKLLYWDSGNKLGRGEKMTEKRKNSHRTITCMRSRVHNSKGVKIHKSVEHGKTFYSGLAQCGSVWACPICAAKIQARRQIEVQKLFKKAYKIDENVFGNQKQIAMITFTFPHGIGDRLDEMFPKHEDAVKILRTYNNKMCKSGLKKFKLEQGYEGVVKALELTYGSNGWHIHTHELWVLDWFAEDKEREDAIYQYLLDRWELACKKVGLLDENDEKKVGHFRKNALHIAFRVSDTDYINKQNGENDKAWGADKEVAQSHSKLGKKSGKTPFQLLLESEETPRYKGLFLEYCYALKGKSQLVWTQGLKGKVGVDEKSDEELLAEQNDTADLLAILEDDHWACVVKNSARGEILDIAEEKGFDGLRKWFADYGLVLDEPSCIDIALDQKEAADRLKTKIEKMAKKNKRKGSAENAKKSPC